MDKIIKFLRVRPPNADGYNDPVSVIGENDVLIETFNGRSTPNPKHPKTGQPWDTCYGCLAEGWYNGCWDSDSRGRYCIIIEEGKELPAILPNKNNGWRSVVKGVEVHSGFKDDDPRTPANEAWSGSAGCLTIQVSQWEKFCSLFVPGEKVKILVQGLV
jgi:hypothetical protein